MVRFARTVLVVTLSLSASSIATAQSVAVAHDTQSWVQFVAHLPVSPGWLVHAEAQPRWNDDVTRKDQVILRGALGRRIGTRTTLWVGHAYIPRWQADGAIAHEQRIWQQLSLTLPRVGSWTPSLRVRPEQRFLDTWGDSSQRLRTMVRAVRPVGQSRWSLAASNEYFHTLDRTAGGPTRGFDQNRLFGGVMARFSPASTIEAGYLWQALPRAGATPRRHNHTALVWFNYAPPAGSGATPPSGR